EAVQQGYLPENAMDTALIRLFTARIRLGMFDPAEVDPYSKIEKSELDSKAHRVLARQIANESMVLLKNDGVLPLKSVKRIAIIGPLAEQTAVLLGNYNGTPTHTVSVLEGMKSEFADAKITYVPGTQFLSNQLNPVPASVLTTPEGKLGLKAEYRSRPSFAANTNPPLTLRVESSINLNEGNLPEEAKGNKELSVQWTGFLNPNATGDYLLGIKADGFARISVSDRLVTLGWGNGAKIGQVHLEKGSAVKIDVAYNRADNGKVEAQLTWA